MVFKSVWVISYSGQHCALVIPDISVAETLVCPKGHIPGLYVLSRSRKFSGKQSLSKYLSTNGALSVLSVFDPTYGRLAHDDGGVNAVVKGLRVPVGEPKAVVVAITGAKFKAQPIAQACSS